jgi:uncharacterized protein with PQ loop repeat
MGVPQTHKQHQERRTGPVAEATVVLVAVVSTLVFLVAGFLLTASQNAESGSPLSPLVLVPALVGFASAWFAALSAADDRPVAIGPSVIIAVAADAATLWLIFAWW